MPALSTALRPTVQYMNKLKSIGYASGLCNNGGCVRQFLN